MIITCGPGQTTPSDQDQIAAFARMLERRTGRPQLDTFFNADQHADNPSLADRRDYTIRYGTIEVAR